MNAKTTKLIRKFLMLQGRVTTTKKGKRSWNALTPIERHGARAIMKLALEDA